MRRAALPILLLVAACGHQSSRDELEDRISKLEDENDTLKQQLGEAQDQLEERTAKAHRRAPAPGQATSGVADTRAPAARPDVEDRPALPRKPHRATDAAKNAAANAVIAAADAREALKQH
jgi:chromosome segregation ATPase